MNRQSETLELPVSVLVTFLAASLHGMNHIRPGQPVMSLEELAERVGYTPSIISHHLRYLSYHYRQGKAGMGLVFTTGHPDNGRKKTFGLTHQGVAVVDQLEEIFLRETQATG